MATKSTDQGWPPPPIRSKCLERVSSRYVRRRMAAALLARVGMIQSAAAKTVPRNLGPDSSRGAGPVLTVRRSRPVYPDTQTCSVSIGMSKGAECSLVQCSRLSPALLAGAPRNRAVPARRLQSRPSGTPDHTDDYYFAKFVPPTVAGGRVFLATAPPPGIPGKVIVYGK